MPREPLEDEEKSFREGALSAILNKTREWRVENLRKLNENSSLLEELPAEIPNVINEEMYTESSVEITDGEGQIPAVEYRTSFPHDDFPERRGHRWGFSTPLLNPQV